MGEEQELRDENPYLVPPFSPYDLNKDAKPLIHYVWWSWHPCYPYWSKSCWKGETVQAALDLYAKGLLNFYHNKLIREGDGQFIEVLDKPCEQLHAWRLIFQKRNHEYNQVKLKPEHFNPKYCPVTSIYEKEVDEKD